MKKIICIVFITIIFFANKQFSYAQNISLSITPPLLEIMIKPGKSITYTYKLYNAGDTTIVTPRLVEFSDTGIIENKSFNAEKWITIENKNISFGSPFLLNKNEEKHIVVKISPPEENPEDDYYRVILFSTTPNPPSEFSQSSISQSIGSILLLSITKSGIKLKAAQISKFELPSLMDSFDPLEVAVDIQNTGKTYFRTIGTIKLTGPIGQGTFTIIPNTILAGQTKRLTTDPQQANITYRQRGIFLGKYQVNVNFTLDESTIKIDQTKSFYAIPWKLLLFVSVTIFIIRKLVNFKQFFKKS